MALKEYVGPDCPCGIEDHIREMHGVLDVAINPVADAVQLTYDADTAGLEHLKHRLAQLGCPCKGEQDHTAHAHMEHEQHKAEEHDHHAMMEQIGAVVPNDPRLAELGRQGKTVIYVAADGRLVGALALADMIRDESREAVRTLKQMGLEVAMLTGDSQAVADYVGAELGLDTVFAEVRPEQKADKVKALQHQGKVVAMVGDGINDAPALVQADVGIAIGAGTDVAVESAQVVLVKNDPRDVVRLIRLSQATMNKMRQNLVWATAYNVIAIPMAAGVLQPLGIVLRPEWGALVMSASTVIVAVNALLLRRIDLRLG